MIALIDYGAGNLTSVRKGLAAAGIDYFTPADPDEIRKLSGLVIPGVGHFSATRAITAAWRMSILGVVECGIPLLGICLGMQYLFEGSEEAPGVPGLGLIPGTCRLIPSIVKVPHVGWNDLTIRKPSRLLADIADGTQAYFTHSYAAPVNDATVATTEYGGTFAAVAERGNIFGVQFHPEKSSEAGLRILRSFATISKSPHFQISK
ncbi:MAG TPA: imidazole glycerol phosphate synthase subunit HisH [Vicinamibacterales bacterium]|nr:imidazole glycerol phosphate synthase subunit HisH [Vicinamibacterales bacterium]